MKNRTRIRSLTTRATTMIFVMLSLSRCCHVESWLQSPVKRQLIHGVGSSLFRKDRNPKSADYFKRRPSRLFSSPVSTSSNLVSNDVVSDDDREFLAQALDYARIGKGHTFPNPAVGCVLVQQDTGKILGAGFHPKAGHPHAEIFALLEAAGHVESGVDAAKSVLDGSSGNTNDDLEALMKEYTTSSEQGGTGPERLFGDALANVPVTAYVTLEPCCHYGKTPPCAGSLSLAKVDRVVVGYRDPNPRVDGGGVKVLQDAGIAVAMANDEGCAQIVESFVKRIMPKDYDSENYSQINGSIRRGLRRLAGQRKAEQSLQQVALNTKQTASTEEGVDALVLPPEWMEHLDDLLWREELVNIRLNKAVQKKKLAKQLGNRIASDLGAHVAQVVGHTVLLYRPSMPEPILDLEDLVNSAEDDA